MSRATAPCRRFPRGLRAAGDACHEPIEEPRQGQGSPDASVVESNDVGSEVPSRVSTVPVSEVRSEQPRAEDGAAEVVAARVEAGEVSTWGEQPAGDACHEPIEEPRQGQGSPDVSVVESNDVGNEVLAGRPLFLCRRSAPSSLGLRTAPRKLWPRASRRVRFRRGASSRPGMLAMRLVKNRDLAQGSPDASVVESNGVGKQDSHPGVPLRVSETGPDQSAATATVAHVGWVPPRAHAHPDRYRTT